MGIFTDYKKKMEEEKQVWESELNEYNKEIAMLKSQIKMACYEYNQEVTTINSERSGMMELIKKLYHFLKEFGEIGAKITYFDFENEAWRKIDVESIINPEKVADITNKENHANYMFAGLGVGAAKVGAITSSAMIAGTSLFAPLAVSALFFPTLFDRGSKQDYLDYCEKHMTALEEYDKNKGILNDLCKTVKLATEIAKLYYGTIGTVKEAINETVIPELSGIRAFLYASSIANKVAEGETLTPGIEPINIMEIQGTRYNEHYLFIKNAVEYYTLIVEIFTNQVLTHMLDDDKITEDEEKTFEKHIKQIENKQKNLSKNVLFTKE